MSQVGFHMVPSIRRCEPFLQQEPLARNKDMNPKPLKPFLETGLDDCQHASLAVLHPKTVKRGRKEGEKGAPGAALLRKASK